MFEGDSEIGDFYWSYATLVVCEKPLRQTQALQRGASGSTAHIRYDDQFAFWLVRASKVYSELGADIVMESITLIDVLPQIPRFGLQGESDDAVEERAQSAKTNRYCRRERNSRAASVSIMLSSEPKSENAFRLCSSRRLRTRSRSLTSPCV
jgi:hypothetical protein